MTSPIDMQRDNKINIPNFIIGSAPCNSYGGYAPSTIGNSELSEVSNVF